MPLWVIASRRRYKHSIALSYEYHIFRAHIMPSTLPILVYGRLECDRVPVKKGKVAAICWRSYIDVPMGVLVQLIWNKNEIARCAAQTQKTLNCGGRPRRTSHGQKSGTTDSTKVPSDPWCTISTPHTISTNTDTDDDRCIICTTMVRAEAEALA